MKSFYIIAISFLLISCSNGDDSISISRCEYTDYYWTKSPDSIIANGVPKYRLLLYVTIHNKEDIVRLCDCEFVSNPDNLNNRYKAQGDSPIILERKQVFPISYYSIDYYTENQINLGVDYVNDIPVD
ncbi:hypothetical protein [Bizionia paragorgiae]|uniref:hypothetical protein n=1 Tax=Bizionia paragorgiae TaxID=283786 RepID=UPI003A8F62EF